MSEAKSERVMAILEEAIERTGDEREGYLIRACGDDADLRNRVDALLGAAERKDEFLSTPTMNAPQSDTTGARIGPYKLLQLIGEGGFGSVFMAEQVTPVTRRVALKIIKLGMDTRQVIARFEAERQALAMMDHGNIARVLDAGQTEAGRPYFVMELVTGDPITEYCDRNHLTLRERLELFAQVCHAVQHAHQKGVIHRDIKPSNILVSTQDGRPHAKIIDFGIAKATAIRLTEKTLFTEHKAMIGTPMYMSPEQAGGGLDIDTRTDVYALGVLLYELLTGTTPFDPKSLRAAALVEVQRIIREVEPPLPSTRVSGVRKRTLKTARDAGKELEAIDRAHDALEGISDSVAARRGVEAVRLGPMIRGELDWIVMKCLEKDRARRYEMASSLASDVRRYLKDEPVQAGPPSMRYRARKFMRRHRAAVYAGTAITITLAAATTLALMMAAQSAQARRVADAARMAEVQARRLANEQRRLADEAAQGR